MRWGGGVYVRIMRGLWTCVFTHNTQRFRSQTNPTWAPVTPVCSGSSTSSPITGPPFPLWAWIGFKSLNCCCYNWVEKHVKVETSCPGGFFSPHLSSTCLTLWILCVCVFADTAHHLLLGFSEPVADPTKHLWGYEKNARLNFLHGYSMNFNTECNIVLFTIFIIYPYPRIPNYLSPWAKKKTKLIFYKR